MKMALFHSILACSAVCGLSACGATIVDENGELSGSDGSPDPIEDGYPDDGGGGGDVSTNGTPCRYLAGAVTLKSYGGDNPDVSYNDALYSFEFATKDIDVHYNDGDVLYMLNMFSVNTVTDDRSFVVDLGDVPLDAVPATVDPEDYPLGNWDEHDDVQAVLHHTYVIRTIDGNTDQWAALRVTSLSPGSSVTFDWIRSPNPAQLDIPTDCF